MGLISRVSSRTYRIQKKVKKKIKNIMVCVKDVNQSDFVYAFASFLKKSGKISVPKWNDFAKTASHKQLGPNDDDWFYVRTAAIARQLYINGTIGVGRMATMYGSTKNRGSRPCHTYKGNGHIARVALQELEKMKLVTKAEKGRKLSKDGQRDMDRVAAQIANPKN